MFANNFASVNDAWGSDFGSPTANAELRRQVNDPLCELYAKQLKDTVEGYQSFQSEAGTLNKNEFSRSSKPLENTDGTMVKKKLKQVAISKGESILDAYNNNDDDEVLERYIDHPRSAVGTAETPKDKYLGFITLAATGVFLIVILDLFFRMGTAYARK